MRSIMTDDNDFMWVCLSLRLEMRLHIPPSFYGSVMRSPNLLDLRVVSRVQKRRK